MGKIKWFVLFLVAFSFICSLFAENSFEFRTAPSATNSTPLSPDDETLPSGGSFGSVVYQHLSSLSGQLKLNGTTVKQSLSVDGSLLTQSAHLGSVSVRGEANLKNSVVSSAFEIIGYLKAEETTFLGPLTLGGIKAVFTHSKVPSIVFRKEQSFKGRQIVELKNKTIVEGSIEFESGKGEVYCYPGCQVFGSIKGGKLIKKN